MDGRDGGEETGIALHGVVRRTGGVVGGTRRRRRPRCAGHRGRGPGDDRGVGKHRGHPGRRRHPRQRRERHDPRPRRRRRHLRGGRQRSPRRGSGNDVLIGDGADLPPSLRPRSERRHAGGGSRRRCAGRLGGTTTCREGRARRDHRFGGVDRIGGGPGDDTAFGASRRPHRRGPGQRHLWGNFGSDTITGGPGDDAIDGTTAPRRHGPPATNVDDPDRRPSTRDEQ